MTEELNQRDRTTWESQIIAGASDLYQYLCPQFDGWDSIEFEAIALLRELFLASGGITADLDRCRFNAKSSILKPREILILYGLACGVRARDPLYFGSLDVAATHRAVSRSRLFVTPTIGSVEQWLIDLRCLPIVHPNLVLSPTLSIGRHLQIYRVFRNHC